MITEQHHLKNKMSCFMMIFHKAQCQNRIPNFMILHKTIKTIWKKQIITLIQIVFQEKRKALKMIDHIMINYLKVLKEKLWKINMDRIYLKMEVNMGHQIKSQNLITKLVQGKVQAITAREW